jgi:hypothetical protein
VDLAGQRRQQRGRTLRRSDLHGRRRREILSKRYVEERLRRLEQVAIPGRAGDADDLQPAARACTRRPTGSALRKNARPSFRRYSDRRSVVVGAGELAARDERNPDCREEA